MEETGEPARQTQWLTVPAACPIEMVHSSPLTSRDAQVYGPVTSAAAWQPGAARGGSHAPCPAPYHLDGPRIGGPDRYCARRTGGGECVRIRLGEGSKPESARTDRPVVLGVLSGRVDVHGRRHLRRPVGYRGEPGGAVGRRPVESAADAESARGRGEHSSRRVVHVVLGVHRRRRLPRRLRYIPRAGRAVGRNDLEPSVDPGPAGSAGPVLERGVVLVRFGLYGRGNLP